MRQIHVEIVTGEPPRVTVDGEPLPPVTAARVLAAPNEIPAVQVEFRGDVDVSLLGGMVEQLDGADTTAILRQAIEQLDPAGFEKAILAHLGGLGGATTGEAAKAALMDWAAGHGSA